MEGIGEQLLRGIESLDIPLVEEILRQGNQAGEWKSLYIFPVHCLLRVPGNNPEKLHILYSLCDAGFDVNSPDEENEFCLYLAWKNGDVILFEALLRCGAEYELSLTSAMGPYTDLKMRDGAKNEFFRILSLYEPGLILAVQSGHIGKARTLVNLWCKMDIEKNGVTLLEMAQKSRNEDIVQLIQHISPSMRAIYHVLAGNHDALDALLNSGPKINLEMKSLSQRSAPLLYFAIQRQNIRVIEILKNHKISLFTHMRDESDMDLPVVFTCLDPDVNFSIIEKLFNNPSSKETEILERLRYKSWNLLQYALQRSVSPKVVSLLLQKVGPCLLCDRNMDNEDVYTHSLNLQQKAYVVAIRSAVWDWMSSETEENKDGVRLLALRGFQGFRDISRVYLTEKYSKIESFLEEVFLYEGHLESLGAAIDRGDLAVTKKLATYNTTSGLHSFIAWRGVTQNNPLPLLHRAVLAGHQDIVKFLLASLSQETAQTGRPTSPDDLRDPYGRSALHYAYGITELGSCLQLPMVHLIHVTTF